MHVKPSLIVVATQSDIMPSLVVKTKGIKITFFKMKAKVWITKGNLNLPKPFRMLVEICVIDRYIILKEDIQR